MSFTGNIFFVGKFRAISAEVKDFFGGRAMSKIYSIAEFLFITIAVIILLTSPAMAADSAEGTADKTILVLPFYIASDVPGYEALGEGLRDLLIADLSSFEDVDIEGDIIELTSGRTVSSTDLRISMTMNLAIAIEHMALKAADLGLGSCWIGGFDARETKKILELDEDVVPNMLLPVGYPAQNPPTRPRLSMEEIVLKTV